MIVVGRLGQTGAASPHFTCVGTADNILLQRLIDDLAEAGSSEELFLLPGRYHFRNTLTLGDHVRLYGSGLSTILEMEEGIDKTVLSNSDTTNGNEDIVVKDLVIDQHGENQRFGGGLSFTGLRNSVFENVVVEKAYNFDFFVQGVAGTTLSGTLNFTKDVSMVTGTGTTFTTELAVGSIVKTAGGRFGRVRKILSDVAFRLDRAWGHASALGTTARLVPPNSGNKLLNCTFKGTIADDNVGLGLFDDSLISGCASYNSSNYGFGPDHAHRLKFVNNTMYNNDNAGIGMETCAYSVAEGNVSYRNSKGIYLLSGAYRNIVSNNQCHENDGNGIEVQYNTAAFPTPSGNTIVGNNVGANGTHGIRVSGGNRNIVSTNHCFNNDQSGIVLATENSVVPDKNQIVGNNCYDNQDAKTQDRGIHISGGTNTLVASNIAFDADHNTAGITDGGTATTLADNVTV